MNRRSFFQSLAAIGSGVMVSPGLFIPKLEPVQWKRPSYQTVILHNRDYERAQYEIFFYDMPLSSASIIRRTPVAGYSPSWMPFPVRGNGFDQDGKLIPIPPFVEVRMEL